VGLNNYISRKTLPSPYEILPGVYSTSIAAQELLAKLCDRLSAELPPSGATGSLLRQPGVPDEWTKLLSMMGVPHDPEGVPPFSTAGYRVALTAVKTGARRLALSLTARSTERARWLAERMIARSPLAPVHIKKEVTVGIPTMSADLMVKHGIVAMWHESWRDIAHLIINARLRELADRYGIVLCYFVGRRYQPDKVQWAPGRAAVGKDRVVMDWTGAWLTADKGLPDVVEPSRYRERFLCCRSRKINASPLAATYPLRPIAKEIEHHLHFDMPFLFHHTGVEDIAGKIGNATSVYMLDVDNHDVNMPPALRDIFVSSITRVFGGFIGLLSTLTFRMPQLIKNDYRGGEGVKLDGDPFDVGTFTADYVNPSGHPFTSLLAKYAGAFYVLDALCESHEIPDNEEGWRDFCNGVLPIKALVAGDNVVIAGHSGLDALQAHSQYALYSPTETFLGLVAVRSGASLTWQPNICSYVINFFTPGRPIGNKQRGDWAAGWLERASVYSRSINYETAHRIVNSTTREVLGYEMDAYAALRRSRAVVVGRSAVDANFMLDQDVIYYKYDVDDISRELVETYFLTIDPVHYALMHEGLISL